MEWAISSVSTTKKPSFFKLISLGALISLISVFLFWLGMNSLMQVRDQRPPPIMERIDKFGTSPSSPLLEKIGEPPPPPAPQKFKLAFYFSFALLFIIILLVVSSSFIIITYVLQNQSTEAAKIIQRLKSGDLKARITPPRWKSLAILASDFNTMADEIESLVDRLRSTDENRTKMLQELAHDLRTPLASLHTLLETMKDNEEKINSSARQELLRVAIEEVDYFHRLVNDLLFLTGVYDFKFGGDFKEVFLYDFIQGQLPAFRETLLEKKITFSCAPDCVIFANPHLLSRLLKNALSNACDFAKSKVAITLKREEKIVLTIEDDGPGLRQEEILSFGQKKISRKYLSQKERGHISIGLGSVIMRRICELHNIDIRIENKVENEKVVGARLILTFP